MTTEHNHQGSDGEEKRNIIVQDDDIEDTHPVYICDLSTTKSTIMDVERDGTSSSGASSTSSTRPTTTTNDPRRKLNPWLPSPLTILAIQRVLVVISSATINGVVFSVVNNFGLFYVHLIELFKEEYGPDTSSTTQASIGNGTSDDANSSTPSNSLLEPLVGKSNKLFQVQEYARLRQQSM